MSTTFSTMKELKPGKYVMIDGEPCKVVEVESSKPGKHGSAKMRVVGIGIFDSQKRTLFGSVDDDVEVPVIERKRGQVITVSGSSAQIMDTSTYESFDIAIPEDMLSEVEPGKEVDYLEALGRRILTRVGK
ncbi:MAG: translation initiation factor IF-5A [Candidatus Micrarchaeia archaeon]